VIPKCNAQVFPLPLRERARVRGFRSFAGSSIARRPVRCTQEFLLQTPETPHPHPLPQGEREKRRNLVVNFVDVFSDEVSD